MTYDSCPACGHKPQESLSVSYMPIHRCKNCGHEFCHQCPGSNNGRKCPECGSTSLETAGRVNAK
jgi:predicted Zn-ribbon and HTH transcriptional regulator